MPAPLDAAGGGAAEAADRAARSRPAAAAHPAAGGRLRHRHAQPNQRDTLRSLQVTQLYIVTCYIGHECCSNLFIELHLT